MEKEKGRKNMRKRKERKKKKRKKRRKQRRKGENKEEKNRERKRLNVGGFVNERNKLTRPIVLDKPCPVVCNMNTLLVT